MIVGLFSLSLVWSPKAAITFLGFVSFLALKEFLSMTPTRRADRRVLFYAYLSVIGQYYFAATAWYGMFIMFIPVLMFVWLPTQNVDDRSNRRIPARRRDAALGLDGDGVQPLARRVFVSHASRVMRPALSPVYPSEVSMQFPGPGLLMFLILVTEMNDIFQYMWGKTLGRRKVAPKISPGKTYAGLIGGVLTTVAFAALIGPNITFLDPTRSLIAGMIIGTAGFAGDLCMSALKRDLKIKDFGATLPGHGGVLDRVDSLIFTAPLFFHFVYYCYG